MTTTTWGGRREGAGRPSGTWPQQLVRLAASKNEMDLILAWTTPRQRAMALMDAALAQKEENGGR